MCLKHSSILSPWPVSQAWPVSKPGGTLAHVRCTAIPPQLYPSLTVWIACSWFIWVRHLRFSDQHYPLVVHVTCTGGVREIR